LVILAKQTRGVHGLENLCNLECFFNHCGLSRFDW